MIELRKEMLEFYKLERKSKEQGHMVDWEEYQKSTKEESVEQLMKRKKEIEKEINEWLDIYTNLSKLEENEDLDKDLDTEEDYLNYLDLLEKEDYEKLSEYKII